MTEEDAHGWRLSTSAGHDFALTEKRKNLMRQQIALLHCEVIMHIAQEQWGAGAIVTRDVGDMMDIYAIMLSDMMGAIVRWQNLDIAARERYPQWLKEMSGHHINPKCWDDSESLENTRL